MPFVKFAEQNCSTGMGHSSNNISSFGLTDDVTDDSDTNNNNPTPREFTDYDNNNHPVDSGMAIDDRDAEMYNPNFLPTTYIGKQPSNANAPLETITNPRIAPPSHPPPIYNHQSELSDLYDFGFGDEGPYDTDNSKTSHVSNFRPPFVHLPVERAKSTGKTDTQSLGQTYRPRNH